MITGQHTVGTFLREKVENMSVWLKAEGLALNDLPPLSNLALVAMAQGLHDEYQDAIKERDFRALLKDKENMPEQMLMIAGFVANNERLHDKFWRYLQLFSDTVSNVG